MNTPAYRRLADTLRTAISSGEYPPGATLPKLTELMAEHQVSKTTVAEAIAVLEREGLVQAVRRRGTVVLDRAIPKPVMRERQVRRDEIGYYFDPTAQGWRALAPTRIAYETPPRDLAALLGAPASEPQLVRDRVIGDPDTGNAKQLAASWLPASIARGTVLEQTDTGHGGIYDRLEEMGYGLLEWQEIVTCRMPSEAERELLAAPPGVPLQRVIRLCLSPRGEVVEINDTVWRSDLFAIGYELTRHETAQR
ncbi:GntR family transcriptional regulator [Streptacidiphilus sp. MAP5-3]|uniref:GntR family transcriptional regulator n=1 Tax=unclassified Streptacidiphilus TaxID=2643834 RepID=UPI003516E3F8